MNTKNPNTPDPAAQAAQDWHPADVKCALEKAGYTLSKLAAKHGLSGAGSLSKTLTQSMPLGEQRIADAIGVHPQVIWPSRYNEDGSRKLQGFHVITRHGA